MRERYDVVIVGGGLSGLACGAILSREGLGVCVLEKHRVIGGCLQSFRRGGYSLDTGMHYIGSMFPDQTMYQYFKYFGVLDKIQASPLNFDGFDEIHFADGGVYRHAIGYGHFMETLLEAFPNEKDALSAYCSLLAKAGSLISPEVLRSGRFSAGGFDYMSMSAYDEIAKLTSDERLLNVLAGGLFQNAGHSRKTSLYEYAMVNHSNIEGAHSFVGDTQHVADAFVDVIKSNGGDVFTGSEVTALSVAGDRLETVTVNGKDEIIADNVISTIHPAATVSLLDNNSIIRKSYINRIKTLENSLGAFTAYLLLKPGVLRRSACNFYLYDTPSVWSAYDDSGNGEIHTMLMCHQNNGKSEYADVVALLIPMSYSHVSKWADTRTGRRGEEYEGFKAATAEKMLSFAGGFFPELRSAVDSVVTASPLTYRDYTGTPDGSSYGIVKDYHNSIVNHLSPRTKVRNLFLSGQSLNVHGCIGVSVSAAVTCGEIVGSEYLAKKIGYA